jgi:hypothetical protein
MVAGDMDRSHCRLVDEIRVKPLTPELGLWCVKSRIQKTDARRLAQYGTVYSGDCLCDDKCLRPASSTSFCQPVEDLLVSLSQLGQLLHERLVAFDPLDLGV